MKLKLFLTGCLAFGTILSGCKKAYDYVKQTPEADLKFCNIKKVTDLENSATFTYNAAGYPISVIREVTLTGVTNFFFRYDKFNRVTIYAADYFPGLEGSAYEVMHKYRYPDARHIVDSTFIFGYFDKDLNVLLGFGSSAFISYKTLDNKGRVVKKVTYNLGWDGQTKTFNPVSEPESDLVYTYDQKGNLHSINSDILTGYNDKPNPRRINKVWMFINDDYSVNGIGSAPFYNCFGLPYKGGSTELAYQFDPFTSTSTIEYMCDCGNGGASK